MVTAKKVKKKPTKKTVKKSTYKRFEFPRGNRFWELRSKHGRDKLFATPQLMYEAACEYFEATDERKWQRKEVLKGGYEAGTIVNVPVPIPYTWEGLCRYLDCHTVYFNEWTDKLRKKAELTEEERDFSKVIQIIRDTIYQQKFEGASSGFFSHHIIARDLGLADKKVEGYMDASGKQVDPPKQVINVTNIFPNTENPI